MQNVKNKAVEYAMDRLDKIDKHYKNISQKSSQWKKLADKIHHDLKKKSLNYYRDGLKDVRNAIRASDRKHPSVSSPRKTGWCGEIKGAKRKPKYYKGNSIAYAVSVLPEYKNELNAIKSMPASTMILGKKSLIETIENTLPVGSNERDIAIDVVHNLILDHPVVSFLVLSKARRRDFNTASIKSLDKMGQKEKTYNFPAVLELAKSLLSGTSYTEVSWALALLTGRRSVEIMRWATFEKIDNGSVMFSGQSKKREGVIVDSFPIPVLADADTIIKAMKHFRTLESVAIFQKGTVSIDGKRFEASQLHKRDLNKSINQRTNGVLNERAQRLMNDPVEVFKNTRSIYARYCSDNIRNTEKRWTGNEDQFLKSILGHANTDQVRHYRQVTLKYETQNDWLKRPEPKEKKPAKPKEKATFDTRAGVEIKQIGEKLDKLVSAGTTFIEIPVGAKTRKVKLTSTEKQIGIRDWHFNRLKTWAYENSHEKITQSAITKNKGNTAKSGTGSVNVNVNRYAFQAWATVAGELLTSYNDAPKRNP